MTRPESYDELITRIEEEYDRIREEEEARAHIRLNQPIRTEIRKMRPTKTVPYDPDFPYVVRNIFSDEGIARFRYESDAADFSEEDLTMYVIDTIPEERPMTDQSTATLIAEARERAECRDTGSNVAQCLLELAAALEAAEQERDNWKMSAEEAERAEKRWKDRAIEAERERDRLDEAFDRDLPWRYDEVEAQRNQLAAVIEKARAEVEGESGWFRHRAGRVLDILATAPADALREVKADVWASGYNAGYSDRSTPGEPFTRNPYKAREERA